MFLESELERCDVGNAVEHGERGVNDHSKSFTLLLGAIAARHHREYARLLSGSIVPRQGHVRVNMVS